MNKNKGASRFKPRYECFERSRDSPYTASVTDRTSKEVRDDPLSGYKAWPAGAKKKDTECLNFRTPTNSNMCYYYLLDCNTYLVV